MKEIDEATYNTQASKQSDRLLLDKKNVVVPGRTSPVEVCDILTQERKLVHVKRKFSSSSLSHLFSQGHVSARLLADNAQFRVAVRDKIGSAQPKFRKLFTADRIVASEWEVVYAIIGPWDGQPASEKIPFFSKVNLRDRWTRLRGMGFEVSLVPVEVTGP